MATLELNGKSLATQTSSAEPVIASTVTGAPALAVTNVTGVLPAGVTGSPTIALTNATGTMPTGTQDNITRLGTVTAGNLSNTAIVYPAGHVIQVVSVPTTDQFTTSSNTFTNCTPMTVNITPSATTSKVLVLVNMNVGGTADCRTGFALQRDSTDIFQASDSSNRQGSTTATASAEDNSMYNVAFQFLDSPSSIAQITYHVQVSAQTNGSETMYLNRPGTNADAQYTKHTASSITVMEISG